MGRDYENLSHEVKDNLEKTGRISFDFDILHREYEPLSEIDSILNDIDEYILNAVHEIHYAGEIAEEKLEAEKQQNKAEKSYIASDIDKTIETLGSVK